MSMSKEAVGDLVSFKLTKEQQEMGKAIIGHFNTILKMLNNHLNDLNSKMEKLLPPELCKYYDSLAQEDEAKIKAYKEYVAIAERISNGNITVEERDELFKFKTRWEVTSPKQKPELLVLLNNFCNSVDSLLSKPAPQKP